MLTKRTSGSCDKSGKRQSSLTDFATRNTPAVSKSNKDNVRRSESLFIRGCQLAFNVVNSAYLRSMCQNLIQILWKTAQSVLPSNVKC